MLAYLLLAGAAGYWLATTFGEANQVQKTGGTMPLAFSYAVFFILPSGILLFGALYWVLMISHRARAHEIDTQIMVLQRLAQIAEVRDGTTAEHGERMARFCVEIGREAGMTKTELDTLFHASQLHDLGKISIPDAILLKPGKLTEEEITVMRQHVRIGANVLEGAEGAVFSMARCIALTHHERWDGKGYPGGLQEQTIPQEGRIAAIADVFDALISARPYKRAWTFEEAVAEVKSLSGTHFDPDLVSCFVKALPAIRMIAAQYASSQPVTLYIASNDDSSSAKAG